MSLELDNYYNEIRMDIAKDFGLEAIGYGQPKPRLSVVQCQTLLHKYGFDKAMIITKRYGRLMRVMQVTR